MLENLLERAVAMKASDLHLSTGLPPALRIDGDITLLNLPVLEAETVRDMLYGIMKDTQITQFQQDLEADFSLERANGSRYRVNAYYQNRGPAAVFRVISNRIRTLDELNCPDSFRELAQAHKGLVLVTGPTGSGKSTTLAAIVEFINHNRRVHIITIEDPIEYLYQSNISIINQREVYRDTRDFNAALRSALREDPDVIMVGELRDLETIRLALTAAETGHLVLGTLHTSSAAKTIDRIIDVFPAAEKPMIRSMLSESLRAVIAQTLLKRADEGRVAAWEIMIGTPAIRNLIREDQVAQINSTIQIGRKDGMQTMDQHLKELLQSGIITRESALSMAQQKNLF